MSDKGSQALTTRRCRPGRGDEVGDQTQGPTEPCGLLHRPQPRGRPGRGMSRQGQVSTRGRSGADACGGRAGRDGRDLCSKAGASEQASGWGRGPWGRLAGPSPPSSPWTLPRERFSLSSGVWGPEGVWAFCPQISGCLGLAASATQVSPLASRSLPPRPAPHPLEEFPEPEGGRKYRALLPASLPPPAQACALCPTPEGAG